MPFNGAGSFSRNFSWATDKSNSVPVTASRMDSEDDGFAAGLSNVICRDGQSTISATIPWNSQGLTGIGNLTVTGVTASTSSTTGCAVFSGGIGVAGRVTADNFRADNQPCFSAHKNGTDQTGIGSGTYTKITFGTELFDIGSLFSNSRWTPPAGSVHVKGIAVLYQGLTSGTVAVLSIHKNGSEYKTASSIVGTPASGYAGLTVDIVDRANGTDYYELFASGTTASTFSVNGAATQTFFMGWAL